MSKEKEEKLADLERLDSFIVHKKPNLIVVAAENKDALLIKEDIELIIKKLIERDSQLTTIPVELISNELAKLFETSKLAEQELGTTMPSLVKQSISLARYVQDPLLCYAQLCNQERDILALKLNPMQQSLLAASGGRSSDDAAELLRLLEIQFINQVNEVGVDLNRCNLVPHTAHLLQFISGLGPRKAQHIVKVLRHQRLQLMTQLPPDKQKKSYPVATNRLFLVTKCTLGRRVFINCAGFIKFDVDNISKEIEEDEENDYEKHTETLDSTRIHPEHYEWARKMAVDAIEEEESENTNIENNSNTALKKAIDNPKCLKDLDLDAFAKELERTGHGNKSFTLYEIRTELSSRYRDNRLPFVPMAEEPLFYCLIKETPASFHFGKLVMCRVTGVARKKPTKDQLEYANPIKDDNTCMWQCQFCKRNDFTEHNQVWLHFDHDQCSGAPVGIRTILDNGCTGFLPLKNLSDSRVS